MDIKNILCCLNYADSENEHFKGTFGYNKSDLDYLY